jgi:hypothetical protein
LLLEALRTEEGSVIRDHLVDMREEKAGRLNYTELVQPLGEAVRLQLLLLLSDRSLVRIIDKCCREGAISIPEGEVRTPKQWVVDPNTWDELKTEISRKGIRCSSHAPIVSMSALIEEAYTAQNQIDDLKWSMGVAGATISRTHIVDHIVRSGPTVSMKTLVTPRKPIAEFFLDTLGVEYVPHSQEELADLLLWKLGFDPISFDEPLSRIQSRLERFREVLLTCHSTEKEEDRERIRSVGVNLFVSMEAFLQSMVSYITWLLATDHYVEENRAYSDTKALKCTARVLGECVKAGSDSDSHRWDPLGKNTFGCLLGYLGQLNNWVRGLGDKGREEIRRAAGECPPAHVLRFRPFGFRHTQLWADCDPIGLGEFQKDFSEIARLIAQAEIAVVRNGIDHSRSKEDFPTLENMLALHGRVERTVHLADLYRLVPKRYWLYEIRIDNDRNRTYQLRDYNGKETLLKGPAVAWGLNRQLDFGEPVLIGPTSLVVGAQGDLVFGIEQESSYSRYWNGYPIVRGS